MLSIKHSGTFKKSQLFLKNLSENFPVETMHKYGKLIVTALENNTPVDTGLTAKSWEYKVEKTKRGYELAFYNTNLVNGWFPVAILLQYGHATKDGKWVPGIDYINPAVNPLIEKMINDVWKEVIK